MKKSLVFVSFIMFAVTVVLGGIGLKPFDLNPTKNDTLADEVRAESFNFTNLIVFCKFAGESEFINDYYGGCTVKQITENNYSLADYSVKDYYEKVSAGKVKMQNLYLYDKSGGSITLSNSRGYYSQYDENSNPTGYPSGYEAVRRAELQQDWAAAINTAISNGATISNLDGSISYDLSELDKNGDGRIDSLTIIYKYSTEFSTSWSAVLWNYQSIYTGVEINTNGKTITSGNYVIMSANYSSLCTDKNGVKFSSLKTPIHEMGHTFGLKDLYKSESNSRVYYMSAMANALSPIPQFLSAKEREALGWLDSSNIQEITGAGSYTIGVTTSNAPTGVVCYKINVPSKNRTLYLEYRKFDDETNKYDNQNKVGVKDSFGGDLKGISALKSGLVCFLVDNDVTFPDNLHSSGWQYEVLGGTQDTKVDSALNLANTSQMISTNLEIVVSAMDENSITFSVIGSDFATEHTHNLQKTTAKSPSCTEEGNIDYWKCSSCNKYFSDSAGINEIQLKDTKIPKVAHKESDWIVDKPATSTQNGHRYKKCNNCQEVLKSEIIYSSPAGGSAPEQGGSGSGDSVTSPNSPDDDSETKHPDSQSSTLSLSQWETEEKLIAIISIVVAIGLVVGLAIYKIHYKKRNK